MSTPPLPAGYSLDSAASGGGMPPLPSGYTLDNQPKKYAPGRAFGMDVARGMGLDADKIAAAEDAGGQSGALKEIGGQVLEGFKGLLKDPLLPITGTSANLEDAIKSGSPGKIMGAVASALSLSEGAERGAQLPSEARSSIGASIHTPEGELTPGVNAASRATGAAAGAGIGHVVGGPVAAAAGGAAGYAIGPTIMDKLFPESPETIQARQNFLNSKTITEAQEAAIKENALKDARAARADALARKQTMVSKQPIGPQLPPPELGSPENPGFLAKLPPRLTQAQQDVLRVQSGLPLGKPSPFSMGQPLSSLASQPDDLISRTRQIVRPGEEPTAADLKRAGDLTQAPLGRLQQLAKFGDRLAQNEINRRLKNP